MRRRATKCRSYELWPSELKCGGYRSFQDDQDRAQRELLQHIDEALACQRALGKVPIQERKVITIFYVPQLLPIEAQLLLVNIPQRLCRKRHLRVFVCSTTSSKRCPEGLGRNEVRHWTCRSREIPQATSHGSCWSLRIPTSLWSFWAARNHAFLGRWSSRFS